MKRPQRLEKERSLALVLDGFGGSMWDDKFSGHGAERGSAVSRRKTMARPQPATSPNLDEKQKISAEQKGLPFSLTEDFLVELQNRSEGSNRYPVLDIEFEWSGRGLKDGSPSLDRVVPALGYVPGNVAIISWRANRIKHEATLAELKRIVTYIEDHAAGRFADPAGHADFRTAKPKVMQPLRRRKPA